MPDDPAPPPSVATPPSASAGFFNEPSLAGCPPLARARGALDVFDPSQPGNITLGGWLLHPDHALNGVRVFVDGVEIGSGPLVSREDLVSIWPSLAQTHRSGFWLRGPLPPAGGAIRTISVVGTIDGRPVAEYRTHRRAHDLVLPTPDGDLLQRVTGNRDPAAYSRIGLDAALDLLRAIARHRGFDRVQGILDWGCGPGRISTQLMNLLPGVEIAGCDLDADAIAWCNTHLRAGAFHATQPFPPLPFSDQSFDAIVAVSVMTHLDWPVQRRWLAEMRRLLRPGGIFAASVHGPFAAAFFPAMTERLAARRFVADAKDKSLEGIAPRGYYRSTFQTPDFTRENWSAKLEVVDYIPAGLAGFQDLAVARRPA